MLKGHLHVLVCLLLQYQPFPRKLITHPTCIPLSLFFQIKLRILYQLYR